MDFVTSYEQRLRHLELTTLRERRIRGDLNETVKIMTGKERVDWSQFFQLSTCEYQLRGHIMKLSKQRTSLDVRKYSFSQVISRCCGCYICEPVQEQIRQVLAKIWVLKAWLNQPIIRQLQVQVKQHERIYWIRIPQIKSSSCYIPERFCSKQFASM